MKCRECGCTEFEEEWVNIPIIWSPDMGTIKSAPKLILKCKECGAMYGSEFKEKDEK